MTDESKKHERPEVDAEDARPPRTITSAELFRGDRELCIDHNGVQYYLRITRRNKLILN